MYSVFHIFANQYLHNVSKCLRVGNLVLFLIKSRSLQEILILKHLLPLIDTLVPTDFYNYILWFIINAAKDDDII